MKWVRALESSFLTKAQHCWREWRLTLVLSLLDLCEQPDPLSENLLTPLQPSMI